MSDASSGRWPVAPATPPAPSVSPVVERNPLAIDPDVLFGIARRRNPKRSALFVSRVLAKHIPVEGARAVLSGLLLGREVAGALAGSPTSAASADPAAAALADPAAAVRATAALRAERPSVGPVVVLGFAETATGLGHLVRDALGADARGVLTTRLEEPSHPPLARFEEEHSHATAHRISHDDREVFATGAPLVLVDDELTTGRTVLNTIAALHRSWPRERYVVAGLLDWRDAEARAAFDEAAERLGTTIDVVSLLSGYVRGSIVDDVPLPTEPDASPGGPRGGTPGPVHADSRLAVDVGRAGGRHGWDERHHDELAERLDRVVDAVAARCGGERVLCVGTEEIMYLPMRVAEGLGERVVVQSTTRSPVVAVDAEGYPIRHRRSFEHPGDPGRPSFLYNLPAGAYDDVVVFVDPAAAGRDDSALVAGLAGGGRRLHVVECRESV